MNTLNPKCDEEYDAEIKAYIKEHELCKLKLYQDTLGFPTIGWGHLCLKRDLQEITQEQADEIFDKDYCDTKFFAVWLWPKFSEYSSNRKKALMDMSFQMNNRLTHFPKALGHIREGNWALAAADFLDSIWARKQTPGRAIDNAILLIEG